VLPDQIDAGVADGLGTARRVIHKPQPPTDPLTQAFGFVRRAERGDSTDDRNPSDTAAQLVCDSQRVGAAGRDANQREALKFQRVCELTHVVGEVEDRAARLWV
jgi:hypothetical protein